MPSRSNPASPSVLDLHPVFTHQGEDGSEGEKEGKAMHNHDQEVKEYEARMQEHRKAAEDEEKKKVKGDGEGEGKGSIFRHVARRVKK